MRKRNSIVFSLVECEEEYVKQLSALVSVFLRPLRMAASSKNPPITHDDVNSIFLNRSVCLIDSVHAPATSIATRSLIFSWQEKSSLYIIRCCHVCTPCRYVSLVIRYQSAVIRFSCIQFRKIRTYDILFCEVCFYKLHKKGYQQHVCCCLMDENIILLVSPQPIDVCISDAILSLFKGGQREYTELPPIIKCK